MSETVTNYNLFYPTNFKLEIPKANYFNYFVQQVTLPSIQCNAVESSYQNNKLALYDNVTDWGTLTTTILMDEEFSNYSYLKEWLRAFVDTDEDWRDIIQDIKLHILSNNKTPLLIFTFTGAFPVSLGEVTLDSASSDPTQVTFTTDFRFQYFTVEKIK